MTDLAATPFPESERGSAEAPAGAMQERAPRIVTTLLVGKLVCCAKGYPCRVRNISSTGMMIETRSQIAVGSEVSVELRHGGRLSGRVARMEGGRAGVQFPAPIDVEQVLREAQGQGAKPQPGDPAPRAPRFEAECPVRFSAYGRAIEAVLENVSQGGARIRFRQPTAIEGPNATLTIPGLAARACIIRWRTETEAGLSFTDIIAFHELAAWLDGRDAG